MVVEEAEHVRKLNKKTEETCERETYYLLTKKSRKLRKRKIVCKWKDYRDTEDETGRSKCEYIRRINMREAREKAGIERVLSKIINSDNKYARDGNNTGQM